MFKLICVGTVLSSAYGASIHTKETHHNVKKIQNDFQMRTKKMGNHLLKRVDEKKRGTKFNFPIKSRSHNRASASSGSRSLASSGTNVFLTVDVAAESCDNEPIYTYGIYLGNTECSKIDDDDGDDDYYNDDDRDDSLNRNKGVKKTVKWWT